MSTNKKLTPLLPFSPSNTRGQNLAFAPLLHGCKAIARHLSLTERQVRHLIARRAIPTFRLGGTHCSTPAMLAEHFADLARAQQEQNI